MQSPLSLTSLFSSTNVQVTVKYCPRVEAMRSASDVTQGWLSYCRFFPAWASEKKTEDLLKRFNMDETSYCSFSREEYTNHFQPGELSDLRKTTISQCIYLHYFPHLRHLCVFSVCVLSVAMSCSPADQSFTTQLLGQPSQTTRKYSVSKHPEAWGRIKVHK